MAMTSTVKSRGLSSRPAAAAYVERVCFKLGPPRLIGAELEWLTHTPDGARPALDSLAAALGQYAPRNISSISPARPLPGGSVVTIEPGGQVELSSSPFPSVRELARSVDADSRLLESMLNTARIGMTSVPADRDREPQRLLVLPRYCAMEDRFTTIGPFGKLMMCNTAAVQVSVDAGRDREDVARRWTMLEAVGPALVAAFACSPTLRGAPEGSWASQRMRTWLELDGSRTEVPNTGDPIADYSAWALDVPLLCIRGESENWTAPPGTTFADWIADHGRVGRPPTTDDLDYHLTTLFPHVRACGHFEIRYLDAQPDGQWVVPAALFDALLSGPDVIERATQIAAETAGRWVDAARDGLADSDLRRAAEALLHLAADNSSDHRTLLLDTAERCRLASAPTAQHSTGKESA
ncbi:ergothioneine biosynthesis glutamate--cysteine ligase EgtA [Rhodococcoides fascians]|uniref:ergothioneine biosynthesis glutamate--cysteine ligase EgtA n=1 Tax=Rhodococcoides fascians TaxID=1828 RepID=UPI00055BA554|nr:MULTISPECIES: ergothioneine biosynthesis glutamate--cysteine ligase EgtA [Rhodococcus]OZC55405.1 ergothioneine biosynthesis glutamate--cysteine ligase EgtA [Rhodococcus sp. 06-621-2]